MEARKGGEQQNRPRTARSTKCDHFLNHTSLDEKNLYPILLMQQQVPVTATSGTTLTIRFSWPKRSTSGTHDPPLHHSSPPPLSPTGHPPTGPSPAPARWAHGASLRRGPSSPSRTSSPAAPIGPPADGGAVPRGSAVRILRPRGGRWCKRGVAGGSEEEQHDSSPLIGVRTSIVNPGATILLDCHTNLLCLQTPNPTNL